MRYLISLLVLALSLSASQITVAVAANVSYAIDELKRTFAEEHP